MTEVVNYGAGHRIWLRNNYSAFGVPLGMYIKEGEEEADGQGVGFLLLVGVGFLLS